MNERIKSLGGVALMVSAAILAVVEVLLLLNGGEGPQSDAAVITNPVNVVAHTAALLGGLVLLVGLPVLAATLAETRLRVSLIGFVLLAWSIVVYEAIIPMLDAVILPYLVANHFVFGRAPSGMFAIIMSAGFSEIIGNLLFGVVILRANVFPRVVGGLLIASSVGMLATLAHLPILVDGIVLFAQLAAFAIAGAQLAGIASRRTTNLAVGAEPA